MRTYCTLFDRNYLYQGLALHDSLKRLSSDFRLYALCMDDVSYRTILKLESKSLVPVSKEILLTPQVSAVRDRTTHGQFCWVCQPLICAFILDTQGAEMVTYLEADSLFFSDPEVLFRELGQADVSLVPHAYSPGFDNSLEAGRFCVQFNAFRRTEKGRAVLDYWKASCFQYTREKPRAYPGQTSLDDWPERFDGVKVIENPGAGVAPWNIQHRKIETINSVPHVDGSPIVFYHFHQYGRYEDGSHELGNYPLTKHVVNSIYGSYVRALTAAEQRVSTVDPAFHYRRTYKNNKSLVEALASSNSNDFGEYVNILKRKLRGTFNVVPDEFFCAIEKQSTVLRRIAKRSLGVAMRLLPLDSLLLLSQRLSNLLSSSLIFRDWRLEAYGRPQFFKHEINLSRWRFEPTRWAFTARGVYARENMFKGCSVLDLSCGDGSNSYLFFSDIAGHIDAVDNDELALEYAKRFHSCPSISYHKIDIVNQPLPEQHYDFVVWNAAICYFSETDIRSILEKIAMAGRPGMVFCGMLPAASGYADHKTEFPHKEAVKALLDKYFGVVRVHEIAEAATRTFYFKASSPLSHT